MRAESNGAAERESRDAARVRSTARAPKVEPGGNLVSSHVVQQRQGPVAGTDNGDVPQVSRPDKPVRAGS